MPEGCSGTGNLWVFVFCVFLFWLLFIFYDQDIMPPFGKKVATGAGGHRRFSDVPRAEASGVKRAEPCRPRRHLVPLLDPEQGGRARLFEG